MEKVIKKTDWRFRLIQWFYTEELIEIEKFRPKIKWVPDTVCSLYYHLFWAIFWSPVRFTALLLEKILLGSENFEVLMRNRNDRARWHGIYWSIAGVCVAALIAFVLIGFLGVILGYDRNTFFTFHILLNPFVILVSMFMWTALFRGISIFVSYIKTKCKSVRFE